jgi:hypothetical protein
MSAPPPPDGPAPVRADDANGTPTLAGRRPTDIPIGPSPMFLNAMVAQQQQQQQRASMSSMLFLTFFFFMMSGGNGANQQIIVGDQRRTLGISHTKRLLGTGR